MAAGIVRGNDRDAQVSSHSDVGARIRSPGATEAIDYVCQQKNIRSIVFGASTRAHIEETKHLIDELSSTRHSVSERCSGLRRWKG